MSLDASLENLADVSLTDRFITIRNFSEQLAKPLSAEDCAIQSMPDASPTKWHLAHTTWFFETFLLLDQSNYKPFDSKFAYLYNSYYNTVGKQFPRPQRGLISRPSLDEILAYREYVNQHVAKMLDAPDDRTQHITEIGLNHEQQHQELMLTDIKHVLSCNPLRPIYREGRFQPQAGSSSEPLEFDEGIYEIGHPSDGYCFDNELPRHRVFLEAFQLCNRLVTCGEYLEFIKDGGYERPEFWLSMGWSTVCEQSWKVPLYWYEEDGKWHQFTLAGPVEIDLNLPVCHVSYFEADAYARWAGMRLPTEAEWEIASESFPMTGNFVDACLAGDFAIHPGSSDASQLSSGMFGDVWQWTASPYTAYPGYSPPDGALGEYNGKFMCNQFVLRGGSCATSNSHIRRTYRNFFPPDARWQFSGIRLCS